MKQSNFQRARRIFVLCLCLSSFWLSLSPVHAQSSEQIHIVRPGETLSAIAARYGISYMQLAQYNRIANPNLIRAGQQLRIPSRVFAPAVVSSPKVDRPTPSEQPPSVALPTPAPTRCRGESSYTVRRGDSLFGIAAYYNVTVSALQARNNLPSSLIQVGQRLIIPSTC